MALFRDRHRKRTIRLRICHECFAHRTARHAPATRPCSAQESNRTTYNRAEIYLFFYMLEFY
jgi:hypothetical protein